MAAASANLFSVFAAALEGAITWDAVWQVFLAVLPVWLFGAVAGWAAGHLLPRPKVQTQPSTWLLTLFSGSGWRKFLLMVHGAVILRDVWRTYTQPGTLRGLSRALWSWVRGQGFHFEFPQGGDALAGDFAVEQQAEGTGSAPLRDADNWYVTHKDLAFFKYHGLGSGAVDGASDWEVMMEKEMPNELKYTAWRRTLPCGKTEYKSVTIAPDATANEFIDIYFDDDFRPRWDGMVVHHEVLEHGDFSQRQQVVRWIRRFPFKFLSDREYIIARRMFKEGQDLYGITKSIRHPRAPQGSKVVRCDTFHSMWRSRNVPCPWGTANPACETILLHHEQFKIPEHLARFAVRHAMWGFIKHMAAVVPEFVARRREVCSPFEMNASAYGSGFLPNPPMGRSETSKSSLSLSSFGSSGDPYSNNAMPASSSQQSLRYRHSTGGLALCGSGCLDGMGEAGEEGEQYSPTAGSGASAGMRRSKSSNLKGLAAVAIASGVAILINKNASTAGSSASTGNVKSLAKRHRELRRKESRVFNL